MSTETHAALWPRGEKKVEVAPLAPRLEGLEGKTVAFLWDYLFRGDEIFPILESELAAAHPGMRFVDYTTFGSTHGEDEGQIITDLPRTLAEHNVDAVVSGMGC
ncbi:MAG: hypothetical protein QF578_08530 [Alphaproteobacteria bacterium]|jgi:hypothetical protein|nr:hypothetical protein [Alphaproteobacteria bacterium]MDP6564857.1 hypothetical protein [Alphaproteobacteria bacterium]MDP6813187.1 hypothetical protein [Alphaproteobacteria bacterium]